MAVLHDLNHTAYFADDIIALRDGRVVASGPTRDVMQPDRLREIYEVDVVIDADADAGLPMP